ncbi:SHOCT domain-containing protein [Pseudofrankia sp. BMG5.37]|uniref:SHOCT domain-containing protein n=1 Tax=Pseudofrankia sp. BMG5.37 TaxID=3050035 RepID=UPI0028949352|nr:SHOCT domain-containing protein [Pseudofrankia sp. BMG5.37]MDT3442872.1 SHOCT domain-containing protein [Pseudofrankia sp. BMG5.37]
MMYGYDHDMSGWGWFAMSVGMLLFWAVLITGAVLLVRALIRSDERNRPSTRPPTEPPATHGPARLSPEQVLADRFARGEIDEQEFRARLAALHEADRLAKR